MTVMHQGKSIMRLNPKYGGNHHLCNCNTTIDQDKVTLLAMAKKKWEMKKTARVAKQVGTVLGQAHIQVSIKNIDGQGQHQDDYHDALTFI